MIRSAVSLPIALTMGEPAGIGLDVTLLAWRQRNAFGVPRFYVLADPEALARRANALQLEVPIVATDPGEAASMFNDALPVVSLSGKATGKIGLPSLDDVWLITDSIERAVDDVRTNQAAALVTNPVSKAALQLGGFAYPGHTEFLGSLAAEWGNQVFRPVMMLAGPELRTVPVTVHIPLREVPSRLTTELIVETGQIVAADLQSRFGIADPRLAVAGINPHAGEEGRLGGEDIAVIRPAVEALQERGVRARGPFPADTLFHAEARKAYDAALCMYHDQALIPAKTLSFDETANVTLGLPFIRTSPDHGTAFDIAGSGLARPGSLVSALKLASQMRMVEASA